jgi:hypothetical protein
VRIYCDRPELFEEEGDYRELERLLMCVRRGQHTLLIDDLERFFASSFFVRAVAPASQLEVQELLNQQDPALADRGIDPAVRTQGPRAELVPIALSERSCRQEGAHPVWEIDRATAGAWSEAPLRLLLENDNDWQLVEAAARVYDRPRSVDALNKGFLKRDQRGGKGEVRKSVESCLSAERVFVLIDSDRTHVGGQEDREQQAIRKLAKTRPNIFPFILAKREVENYIPETVWRDAVEKRRTQSHTKYLEDKEWAKRLRTWSALSDIEKDFTDMEKYFPEAKQQVAKLCDPVLVPDVATLESRSGKADLVQLLNGLEAWL